MIKLQHYAAGLLALAAGLVISADPGFALSHPRPLAVAQELEARTSGGLYDPSRAATSTETRLDQRDARPR